MHEQTTNAEGTKLKGGATRRIAVTMDEQLFLDIKAVAMEADRSISSQIIRYLKNSSDGGEDTKKIVAVLTIRHAYWREQATHNDIGKITADAVVGEYDLILGAISKL